MDTCRVRPPRLRAATIGFLFAVSLSVPVAAADSSKLSTISDLCSSLVSMLQDSLQVTSGPVVATIPQGGVSQKLSDRGRCEVMAAQTGGFQGAVISVVKRPIGAGPIFPTSWTTADRIDNPRLTAAFQRRRNIAAVSASNQSWTGAVIVAYQPAPPDKDVRGSTGPLKYQQLTSISDALTRALDGLET